MNRSPTLISRRRLLQLGAAAAVAALRPWDPTAAIAAPSHLRRSSYAGRVGRRVSAGKVALHLMSVADVAGAGADRSLASSEDAFALVFAGPLDPALETGIHRLRAHGLGSFELFLSPIERPGAERLYEAVVDRSVGAR